jgi:hypothetical protein
VRIDGSRNPDSVATAIASALKKTKQGDGP